MADEDPTVDAPDTDDTLDDTTPEETPKPTPPADPPKPKGDEVDLKEAALRKANREASERRAEIKRLQSELDSLKVANASEAERALIEARKDAAEAAEAKWRPAVVEVRADLALDAAGCKSADDRELLLGKVDMVSVELDEKGRVVSGLAEQVAALKERFPRMFEAPTPVVPSARQVDSGDKKPPVKVKTATELLADRLNGITR